MDRHSAADPDRHGGSCDQNPDRDLRYRRRRSGHPGHRLSVALAVQLHGRGRELHEQHGHAPGTDHQSAGQGRALSARGGRAAGGAHRPEDPLPDHLRRRHPFLVGAGAGGEEGCHPRLHQRVLDPHRRARHLPWPVHRAVRAGPRLHADRGRGPDAGGLRHLAGRAQGDRRRRSRADQQGMDARGADGTRSACLHQYLCRLPPGQRRRDAAGVSLPQGQRTGAQRHSRAYRCGGQRGTRYRHGRLWPAAVGNRHCRSDHLRAQRLGQRHRRHSGPHRYPQLQEWPIRRPVMSAVIDHHTDHAHGPAKGLMRWVLTTNHKDIGSMYLWFSFAMFLLGGTLAMVIRAELFQPGLQLVDPNFFNQMTTMHGLIMVFGAVMPAFVGLANWMVPLMIGAPDMALPRMNNFSFWLLPAAFGLLVSTLFMEGGAPNFGWTFYAPLSTTYGPQSTTFFIFAIHLAGISSIMGAINIIATILNMRAPGMTLMKMPMFAWTWLITAFLLIAVMPVLAGVVTMMLMDIHFGTSFFSAAGGGDPVLFQHVFWFFGHPEVYIMILPAFGAVSMIIPAFSRKPLFGYTSMVYATGAIAFLSFAVWAHHMFTVGIPLTGQLFFMYATMLIAVPTGVKVFNWATTMFRGSLSFEAPMLFAVAFVILFTIGGFSGLMLAIAPADYQYHDTYFVVAHFHYVLVPGAIFGIFASAYYWLPKWTGHMYDEVLAKTHFWMSFIGMNLAFFPMHFVGLAGMPRRIPDYNMMFANFNMVSSIGAFMFGATQLLFLYIVIKTIRGGKPAPAKPWDGAEGLEWTVPSPAPYHTFSTPPEVK